MRDRLGLILFGVKVVDKELKGELFVLLCYFYFRNNGG